MREGAPSAPEGRRSASSRRCPLSRHFQVPEPGFIHHGAVMTNVRRSCAECPTGSETALMALTLHVPHRRARLPVVQADAQPRDWASLPLALMTSLFALPWLLLTFDLPPEEDDYKAGSAMPSERAPQQCPAGRSAR